MENENIGERLRVFYSGDMANDWHTCGFKIVVFANTTTETHFGGTGSVGDLVALF